MFVEFVIFKTNPGVSDAQVIEKAQVIQQLAAGMGVPFELELLKSEEGEWVEVARWNSKEEAQRVEQAVMNLPEAQQAMAVMDESSLRMMFLHPVESRQTV